MAVSTPEDGQQTLASRIRDRPLAYFAGAAGIVGQLASAYLYVLLPLLVVPSPALYGFIVAWFVLDGLAIAWWPHHPMRSFVVPIVSVPVAVLVLWLGGTLLGWSA